MKTVTPLWFVFLFFSVSMGAVAESKTPIVNCFKNYHWDEQSADWRYDGLKQIFYSDNSAMIEGSDVQLVGSPVATFFQAHTPGTQMTFVKNNYTGILQYLSTGNLQEILYSPILGQRIWNDVTCVYPDGSPVIPLPPEPGTINICKRRLAAKITTLARRPYCDSIRVDDLKKIKSIDVYLTKNDPPFLLSNSELSGLDNLEQLWLGAWDSRLEFEPGLLAGLTRLNTISISGDQVDLNERFFEGVSHLQYLSLETQAPLPKNLFKYLSDVETLYLKKIPAQSIHPDDLSSVASNLRILSLDANQYTQIPTDLLVALPQLQYLWLKNQSIAEIPRDSFGPNSQIKSFELELNQVPFQISPDSFSAIKNTLTTLTISAQLTTLPMGTFKDFPVLNNLNLASFGYDHVSNNKISSFPDEVSGMPKLNQISLDFNPICRDQAELKKLSRPGLQVDCKSR